MSTINDGGPSVWQPIETAPKDGTCILVTNPEAGGAWVAKYQEMYTSGYRPKNPWPSMMLNLWHLPVKYPSIIPTHWMPLPAPPVAQADALIAELEKK